MSEKFTVRDRRGGDRYFIDNAFLRGGWGAKLGPYAIAVYNALALHVDADGQDAFPSYSTLGKLTNMSRRQVIREIRELEDWNIIHKATRYVGADEREQTSNEYVLLNKSEWRPVASDSESPPLVTVSHHPGDSESPKQDSFKKIHNNKAATLENEKLTARPVNLSTPDPQPDLALQTVSRTYEQEIGGLSPLIADSIKDAIATYPVEWITKAISRAAEMNKRRWAYVAGILKNWQVIGGPQNDKPPERKQGTKSYQPPPVQSKLNIDPEAYNRLREESEREIYKGD